MTDNAAYGPFSLVPVPVSSSPDGRCDLRHSADTRLSFPWIPLSGRNYKQKKKKIVSYGTARPAFLRIASDTTQHRRVFGVSAATLIFIVVFLVLPNAGYRLKVKTFIVNPCRFRRFVFFFFFAEKLSVASTPKDRVLLAVVSRVTAACRYVRLQPLSSVFLLLSRAVFDLGRFCCIIQAFRPLSFRMKFKIFFITYYKWVILLSGDSSS